MTEQKMIEWLRARVPAVRSSGVLLGIGDDCAIFRQKDAKDDLVFTADLLVENVHFRRADDADIVGHRALARSLSDIAAMGAEPRFCLVSIAVPGWAQGRWLRAFYRGLLKLADKTGVMLAGGDLSSGATMTCDVMVAGGVPSGKALRRDGARPGDKIFVSGPLGAAAARGFAPVAFSPRLHLGRSLRNRASACMDLSDGLSQDLLRLCRESKVSAELTEVPIAAGATIDHALHGGDDYELLFTLPDGMKARHPGVTQIGTIVKGKAGVVRLWGKTVPPKGWDHFGPR